MTVVRKCDMQGGQGGVKGIRKVCQLMQRCDGHVARRCKVMCRGVTPFSMLRIYLTVTREV